MQIEHTITEELEQWGWWAQDCPSRSLNYDSTSGLMPVKRGSSPLITDDRAVEIDAAISLLFNGDKDAIRAIKLRFVCGLGYRDIGKALNVSKDKAQNIVDNCVSWLTGYLFKH
jgi:hypothetical protein